MLETPSRNPALNAAYARAHLLRARAFADVIDTLRGLLFRQGGRSDEKLSAVDCQG